MSSYAKALNKQAACTIYDCLPAILGTAVSILAAVIIFHVVMYYRLVSLGKEKQLEEKRMEKRLEEKEEQEEKKQSEGKEKEKSSKKEKKEDDKIVETKLHKKSDQLRRKQRSAKTKEEKKEARKEELELAKEIKEDLKQKAERQGWKMRGLTCKSRGKKNECKLKDGARDVQLKHERDESKGCVKGKSWGVAKGKIWVSDGCRAEFIYATPK